MTPVTIPVPTAVETPSPRLATSSEPQTPHRRNTVEIRGVTKSFGRTVAVRNLSLTVPERTVCGFIGPNGSGKTTTLRLIMRIYRPDEGAGVIRVFGHEGLRTPPDRVGYLPEERGLYKRMKVVDILRFYAELKGCRNIKRVVYEWLEHMDLTDAANKRVEALSKGMAQKVQFITAVINRPQLLILDEPFSGLDPVNADVLRKTILHLKREGSTIIYSTHDMHMAEKMCDYIVMMYKGDKVLDGTLGSIQETYGADTIRVRLEDDDVSLTDLPDVERISDYGRLQELRMNRRYDSRRVLEQIMRRGKVLHFEVSSPSLHDIFVRIAAPFDAERRNA